MKTLKLMVPAIALAVMLGAPTAIAGDDAVITSISKEYNQAQATIKTHKRSQAKNDMVTTMRYDVPGKGAAVETLHFFFNVEQYGDQGEFINYQLFLSHAS